MVSSFFRLKILNATEPLKYSHLREIICPPDYSEEEKQLLCRRGLIETVNDQLKNLHQIEHSHHRSVNNFMMNIMAAVIAYCLNPNKPTFRNILKQ